MNKDNILQFARTKKDNSGSIPPETVKEYALGIASLCKNLYLEHVGWDDIDPENENFGNQIGYTIAEKLLLYDAMDDRDSTYLYKTIYYRLLNSFETEAEILYVPYYEIEQGGGGHTAFMYDDPLLAGITLMTLLFQWTLRDEFAETSNNTPLPCDTLTIEKEEDTTND